VRDVVLIGSGPAALLLAVACGREGLSVEVLGGEDEAWPNNYGVWVDELEAAGLGDYLGARWSDAEVLLDDERRVLLGRAYGRVARRRLRAHLLEEGERLGVAVRWARASAVDHALDRSWVTDSSGERHEARLVIDASGAAAALLQRTGEPTAWQAAYGVIGTMPGHPWSGDVATFMDWRPADGDAVHDGPPSFLYAMPLSGNRVLVEETSLVHAPAVPFVLLRDRLRRRLARRGLRMDNVEHTELCLIPMDLPLPDLGQRVVGFGAAAALIHPATGYQLGRALRAAPAVAARVAAELRAGATPAAVARAAWQTLWPMSLRATRELLLYGSRVVQGLDHADTVAFFDAFFRVPPGVQRGYLAGDRGLWATAAAMTAVMSRCPARVRGKLVRGGALLPSRMIQASLGVGGSA
jgi:lycopene beta-cyclase